MRYKTVKDVEWARQRALVRVDFNVPLDAHGCITDDIRIRAALPTLEYLLERGASLVLVSHLGRPKAEDRERLTLRPVADRLAQILHRNVSLVTDIDATPDSTDPNDQAIMLLENTRFHKGEIENDPDLARRFSRWGDIYVNDAFGSMHRAHASTLGVARFLPAVAGLLVAKEIHFLSPLTSAPERPLVVLMGGAKISDKIEVIQNLMKLVDAFLLGGGMANTFLQALGHDMGSSLVEQGALHLAKEILDAGRQQIQLPSDLQVGAAPELDTAYQTVGVDEVPRGWMALDIGEATVAHYANRIGNAATVFWNGPMGLSEVPPFNRGTDMLARCLAELKDVTTVIGGGDSAASVRRIGLAEAFSHVSTGGGATLEFLAGKTLPSLSILKST